MDKEINVENIILLDEDVRNLQTLLNLTDGSVAQYSAALKNEVGKATVVTRRDLPGNVITMHSSVTVIDQSDGESMECTVVYPWEADADNNRISVLAPLGTALLGYREGDSIDWKVPAGTIRYVVRSVRQPDASA
ncbi:MAG: GreA/GreB family elongation factor [Chitinispirillaceae bacterium]|nr:GreA/GreB family elongation factor [Chitinispirillaceae bacterium]